MTTISIALPDHLVDQLRQLAKQKNMSLDKIIQLSSEDWLERQEQVESAVNTVLEKNAGVFEQLAEHELMEQRLRTRALLVAAGLSHPKVLEQPLKGKLTDEERLELARQFTGTKELAQMIIDEREEN